MDSVNIVWRVKEERDSFEIEESEERRIGKRMEPARKRRISPVWEYFDLISPNKVN